MPCEIPEMLTRQPKSLELSREVWVGHKAWHWVIPVADNRLLGTVTFRGRWEDPAKVAEKSGQGERRARR